MCGRGTLHDIIGSRKLTKLTLLDLLDFLFPHTFSTLAPFFSRSCRSLSVVLIRATSLAAEAIDFSHHLQNGVSLVRHFGKAVENRLMGKGTMLIRMTGTRQSLGRRLI